MKAYDFHGKRNICGDRIREARLRARLSQSDLCRRLQLAGVIVERDVISRIENGGRFVADFEVVVIADVLEVSVTGCWAKNRTAWSAVCTAPSIFF